MPLFKLKAMSVQILAQNYLEKSTHDRKDNDGFLTVPYIDVGGRDDITLDGDFTVEQLRGLLEILDRLEP